MKNYIPNSERYNTMKYKRCGKSGLLLPMVSLGLWHNFGSDDDINNIREMLLGAFDLGITYFDLANNYGPKIGAAEENFGKILKSDLKNYRDELIISTKAGYRMWQGPYGEWGSKKYLTASLDQSLKRMGLDYVDIFYSHRPDPDTPLEETCEALAQAVKSGKALYVGVSNYTAEQTERAYDILKGMGVTLLIHQPSYSMMNRWVEDSLLDTLDKKGMGCIAFSPLAQGRLTNRYFNGIPANSRAGKPGTFLKDEHITKELITTAKMLDEIAQNRGQTLAQMALAWILKRNTMTSVLIGASSLSQIRENKAALDNLDFSAEELEKIEEILKHN